MPWLDGLSDASVGFLLVTVRLADAALQRLAGRREQAWRSGLIASCRLVLAFGVAVPLLMALAQFCPPRVHSPATPASIGLPFEEIALRSEGIHLSAWYIPASSADAPVVLIAHGLGTNKAGFLHVAQMAHLLGCHVVMFDFRGHGDSSGRITTFGYLEAADVRAARDWIARRLPGRRVIALGYSMGAAAVLRAAALGVPFDGIIADSSFARAEDVAMASLLRPLGPLKVPAWHAGRFWSSVLAGVDLDDHQPLRCMPALAGTPVLLIHGEADTVIPCDQSRQLAQASGGKARLWIVPGSDHIQAAMKDPSYTTRVGGFIDECSGPSAFP